MILFIYLFFLFFVPCSLNASMVSLVTEASFMKHMVGTTVVVATLRL